MSLSFAFQKLTAMFLTSSMGSASSMAASVSWNRYGQNLIVSPSLLGLRELGGVRRHGAVRPCGKLDRYGRHLARRAVEGSVAEWLAANGWGVPYRQCECETVRAAANRAKASHVGIWSGSFAMPWEWRKAH
jgi:hypothetical protein